MSKSLQWENQSVLSFAQGSDPIKRMETFAQQKVFEAISLGWSGPPFDPLGLANLLRIQVSPNAAITDARVYDSGGKTVIEFNPNRPAGRVNFSIAHEIAHTFFSDWREKIRNRERNFDGQQSWQLEMLCNIGAAEILMPLGSFPHDVARAESIESVMEIRKQFDVSTEAILIRLAKISPTPLLVFAASRVGEGEKSKYRIDYSIPSVHWQGGRIDGLKLSNSEAFSQCVAIGTTANARESWPGLPTKISVHAVGLPPYPGSNKVRIAGFVKPAESVSTGFTASIEYRHGDASKPFRESGVAILHVVNDRAHRWGGHGFALDLYREHPAAAKTYEEWARVRSHLELGAIHAFKDEHDRCVISLVAQSGFGPSNQPRLKYDALAASLSQVSAFLKKESIKYVQMPRIGSGQAGGNWKVIEGMVFETMVVNGIDVKVYEKPPR